MQSKLSKNHLIAEKIAEKKTKKIQVGIKNLWYIPVSTYNPAKFDSAFELVSLKMTEKWWKIEIRLKNMWHTNTWVHVKFKFSVKIML